MRPRLWPPAWPSLRLIWTETALLVIRMAVPLVAICGNWMRARLTSSMLKALGRPEWIAEDRGEYVQILQTLTADRAALAAIKQSLRAEVLARELCDQRGLARDLGAAFGGMAEGWMQSSSLA